MIDFVIANIGPLMFVALVVFLLLGYPVAFALGAVGLSFGLLGVQLGLLHPALFQALPERIFAKDVATMFVISPVLLRTVTD